MLELQTVAEELAAAINTAQLVLNDNQITALPYLPDAFDPPTFCVCEFDANYHVSHGGRVEVTFTCRLFTSRATDDEGQSVAQEGASFTPASSIVSAIEATRNVTGSAGSKRSLSGAADDLIVRSARGPRLYQFGEVNFYGIEFTVFVTG